MDFLVDLHTHTNCSTHAFNSITEMARGAKERGLEAIAITDHGPEVIDAPIFWYFSSLVRLPDFLEGIPVLKGIESNVMDIHGRLDVEPLSVENRHRCNFDWVIASLHSEACGKMNYEQCTKMWLTVAENPLVDMIGHPEDRRYLFDYDLVTKAFTKNNKVVEVNANSHNSRPNSEQNMVELLAACKRNNTKIAVNTDSHSIYSLRDYSSVIDMVINSNIAQEYIVNINLKTLAEYLDTRGKDFCKRIAKK